MPGILLRVFGSLFICLFIVFSLQLSIFPGMGLNRIYVWPGASWRTMQTGQTHNFALRALGATSSGKTVEIDLEKMFEYIGGGHRPSLLIFMEPLFTLANEYKSFKDRFCRHVVDKYNQKISSEEEKVKTLNLFITSWPKNRENKRESLYTRLTYSWKS